MVTNGGVKNGRRTLPLAIVMVFVIGFAYPVLNFNLDRQEPSQSVISRQSEGGRRNDSGHGHRDEGVAHSKEAMRDAVDSNDTVTQKSHDELMDREDGFEAERLKREVRVLCLVMTNPEDHATKAIHVKNTWGQRCTKLLFFSTEPDDELGTIIALKYLKEGRHYLWAKVREAFKYVYKHHFEEADWFMRADDDTFVILENLRYMLKAYDPGHAIQFGSRFYTDSGVKQEYMSSGAGYVLSKEALRRFMEYAYPNKTKCSQYNTWMEDVQIGKCLESVGAEPGDTRDTMGRERFFQFNPEQYATPEKLPDWYSQLKIYPQSQGMDYCSDTAVSFHFVEPNQMYVLEYLIYHLRPYGISQVISSTSETPIATSTTSHLGSGSSPVTTSNSSSPTTSTSNSTILLSPPNGSILIEDE